jgi:TolA-binding protein
VIGITWASSWSTILFSPLTSAFDGGSEEIEAKALYSSAQTKRNKGQFQEAIQEIEHQLESFPNDFRGLFLMAEIQSEHLQDLEAAQSTIDLLVETHEDNPPQAAGALMSMADWCLKQGQTEQARRNLQTIVDLFPNTSSSQLASQRIAHLENAEHTRNERGRTIVMQSHYVQHVGLNEVTDPAKVEDDATTQANQYLAHLQEHPLDIESRQRLAALYVHSFERIDLAQLEYEQLIAQPNQSPKQIAQHLNLLADGQAKLGHGDAARKTLQRIIEKFPKTSLADAAQTRLAHFGSEMRGQQKSQASVKLGSYKKDLGLNRDH